MARARKGRDISGWLVIDKPAGPTSTAVVGKVRWALRAKKAGHAGTLDPDATGVLAVAVGEATKTVPYIADALKAYRFKVRLGQSTTTDDASGDVVAQSSARPTDRQIEEALGCFVGQIEQVPPLYSAVKIDGERAYRRAREGENFKIAPRSLWVETLTLTQRYDQDTIELDLICGKGGYVRSVARDLGAALGCHGHVLSLRRTWSGPFDSEGALTLDQLDALAHTADLDRLLRPLENALRDVPRVTCSAEGATRLRNGMPEPVATSGLDYGTECWVSCDGQAVAVGRYRGGLFHPSRVFAAPQDDTRAVDNHA
ncbi:MAG: tRNA pseudouridine(55) synthase TruB [Pseudomonadota bacterium]